VAVYTGVRMEYTGVRMESVATNDPSVKRRYFELFCGTCHISQTN
jgi:hypothetical protein